jgi:hypothetical protein
MAVAHRGGRAVSARIALIVLGLMLGGYGAVLVWENPPVIIMRIVVWALVGVVLHDLVFAPVCVALGFAARRLIPGKWWPPIALAAFCSVVLVFLAIPVYGKPGLRPDNMTVLDRNYPLGLWISLGVVWACVPLYYLAAQLRMRAGRGNTAFHAPGVEIDTRAVDHLRGQRSHSPHVNLGDSTQQLPVRQDEVVEQKRPDDVEPEPPAL